MLVFEVQRERGGRERERASLRGEALGVSLLSQRPVPLGSGCPFLFGKQNNMRKIEKGDHCGQDSALIQRKRCRFIMFLI